MKANLYTGILCVVILGGFSRVTAQEDKNLNREMTLEREYDPSVQDASKINSLPAVKEPVIRKSPIGYADFTLPVEPQKELGILSSGRVMTDLPYNKRRGYFNFGGGNYLNLNGDIGYHILNTDKDRLRISFSHRSTNGKIKLLVSDGEPAVKSKAKLNDNLGGIDFTHEFEKVALLMEAKYGYSAFNYYGYYPGMASGSDTGKNQANQQVFFKAGVESKKSETFNYLLEAEYRSFSHKYGLSADYHGVKENAVGVSFDVNADFDGNKRIGLAGKVDYLGYTFPSAYKDRFAGFNNHAEITLTPYFALSDDNWKLKLGVNAMLITGEEKKFFVSPNVQAELGVGDATVLYADLSGRIHANSVYDVSLQNRYANPVNAVMASRTWLDGTVGIRSGVLPGFWFDVFAGYNITDKNHFFIPSVISYAPSAWRNMGNAVYTDSRVFRVGASLKYQYQKLLDLNLKGVYNSWHVSDYDAINVPASHGKPKAWNKPEFELEAGIRVKPVDKVAVGLGYYLGAGRYTVLNTATWENVKMKNISELNLTGSYLFNDTFSIYLKFNNVLNRKYDLFYGYTAQGFNAMLGVNINF